MVFLYDQTFFDSQLQRTIFSDLIKIEQFFFHSSRTQNNFSPFFFHLILRKLFRFLEMSPHVSDFESIEQTFFLSHMMN